MLAGLHVMTSQLTPKFAGGRVVHKISVTRQRHLDKDQTPLLLLVATWYAFLNTASIKPNVFVCHNLTSPLLQFHETQGKIQDTDHYNQI